MVTRARRLEPAQECLLLAGSNEQDPRILLQGINQLKLEYPDCIQAGWKTHGQYLYSIHGGYITERGYNMELIREMLEIQTSRPSDEPEPEGEGEDEEVHSEPDGEEAEEGNSEGGLPSSNTSSGRITVENEQERRTRYYFSEMGEVSSPEYWIRLHHWQETGELFRGRGLLVRLVANMSSTG